MDFPSLIL